jgi:hypothetical protein
MEGKAVDPLRVTQVDLARLATLQGMAWHADADVHEGAKLIEAKIRDGAFVEPGELHFDRKLGMARTRRVKETG